MKRLETKAERLAARWIPKDAIADPRSNDHAGVFLYCSSRECTSPAAMAFIGTASKPTWNYRFRDPQSRERRIADFFAGIQASLELKALRKLEYAAFHHTLKVGDVLVNSWGWEQTNIDFFEVTKVTPGSNRIEIRAIGQDAQEDGCAAMTGSCTARPGKYIGPPMVKVVGTGNRVKIHGWGSWAYLWDGNKERWSSYA